MPRASRCHAVLESLPKGRKILTAVQGPAAYGGFGHELAPTDALLTIDIEIALIC